MLVLVVVVVGGFGGIVSVVVRSVFVVTVCVHVFPTYRGKVTCSWAGDISDAATTVAVMPFAWIVIDNVPFTPAMSERRANWVPEIVQLPVTNPPVA